MPRLARVQTAARRPSVKVGGVMVEDELWDEFHHLVVMTAPQLRDWLTAAASADASGVEPDVAGAERSRAVVGILGKDRAEITDDDVAVMRSVVSEIQELRGWAPGTPAADDERRRRLMRLGHHVQAPGAGSAGS